MQDPTYMKETLPIPFFLNSMRIAHSRNFFVPRFQTAGFTVRLLPTSGFGLSQTVSVKTRAATRID